MGEVYRGRDTRLGREVAIKVLPADKLSDPARRARFLQEARIASALNHPHIVTIYEIESAEGVDFIVMELVPGKTLEALIPRHGMRLGEALRIAIPLADALAAAHGAGIVHRDLKPKRPARTIRPSTPSRNSAGRGGLPGRPPTCHRSRPRAESWTRAATSSPSGPCCTRW